MGPLPAALYFDFFFLLFTLEFFILHLAIVCF